MTEAFLSQENSAHAVPVMALDWAFRAHSRFLGSLSSEVRRYMGERREEAYAVVYGRTQVGKSTLILNLLGLRPDAIGVVSTVLRGGRATGYSSTAVPTEYRCSHDEHWRIHWSAKTHKCASDCEAEAEFAQVRKAMEQNAVSPTAGVCVVEIPARHFDNDTTGARDTRILDLPGIEAADSVEREFVERVARSLVPNADLILLVGRADDLSFLSPEHVALPGIADWQCSPRRFRIVTTYSFTPESVREFARETGCVADVTAYRARLISELQRFRPLQPEALNPDLYFPLEFGDSWKRSGLDQTPLKAMVDRLMEHLRRDIADAMSPIGRLMGALDAHIVVAKVHEARLKVIAESEKKLERAHAARAAAAGQLEKKLQKETDWLAKKKAAVAIITDATITHGTDALVERLRNWALGKLNEIQEQITDNKDTGTFLSVIDNATHSLRRRIPMIAEELFLDGGVEPAAFWRRVYKHSVPMKAENVSAIAEREFAALRSKLEDYVFESYWFTGEGSDYFCDVNALMAAYKRLIEETAAAFTSELSARAEEIRCQLYDEMCQLESKALGTKRYLIAEQLVIDQIKLDLTEHNDARRRAESRCQEEMERSNQFITLLAEEYNHTVETTLHRVINAPDAVTAFEELVYGSMLPEARNGVLARIGNLDR